MKRFTMLVTTGGNYRFLGCREAYYRKGAVLVGVEFDDAAQMILHRRAELFTGRIPDDANVVDPRLHPFFPALNRKALQKKVEDEILMMAMTATKPLEEVKPTEHAPVPEDSGPSIADWTDFTQQ